ncbi:MAG: hypothetical protein IJ684_01960, partial [Bacteroidales bacterium]|nr:hypothetical protein [Bacteroidales bacterium]
MRQKRFLSWIMVFTLLVGMFSFPAYAEGNNTTTTISGDGTADKTGTMTITLVIQEMQASADDVSVAYDGQPHGITVNVTDPASGSTVKYGTAEGTYDLDASPTQTEVGTLTVYYQVTADNYVTKTGSATVTISKADAAAATVTADNRTYDGTDKPLVTVDNTTLVGGEMQYALGTETAATQPYTTSIPSKTNAGTYYVWYRVVGDENHNSTKAQSVEVTIAKATPGITAPTAKTGLIYTGSAQELVNAGSTKDGTLYYAVTTENKAPTNEKLYATSVPAATDAGTYYVWYKVKGDENHNDYGPYPVAVTILNAKVAPKAPTGESLVYNGKQQSLVKAGSVEGGTLVYAVGKDGKTAPAKADFKADIPTQKDAGTYYVWYKVEGDRNHNSTDPVALEAKIARKSLVVTAAGKAKTYGEADPELSWTQEGLVDGDAL